MKLDYKIEIDKKAIQARVEDLIDDTVMTQIHNEFARLIDPWVPFLHGPLSQTVEINPTYIRYGQPYAHYQYTGVDFNHTLDPHPLASAEWDKVAMQTQMDIFSQTVKEILIRKARELYG